MKVHQAAPYCKKWICHGTAPRNASSCHFACGLACRSPPARLKSLPIPLENPHLRNLRKTGHFPSTNFEHHEVLSFFRSSHDRCAFYSDIWVSTSFVTTTGRQSLTASYQRANQAGVPYSHHANERIQGTCSHTQHDLLRNAKQGVLLWTTSIVQPRLHLRCRFTLQLFGTSHSLPRLF